MYPKPHDTTRGEKKSLAHAHSSSRKSAPESFLDGR
jgi:hypothetical protein